MGVSHFDDIRLGFSFRLTVLRMLTYSRLRQAPGLSLEEPRAIVDEPSGVTIFE